MKITRTTTYCQLCGIILLCCVINSRCTVVYKVGLMIPWDTSPDREFAGETSAGAATLAIETLNTNSTVLPGVTLQLEWRDTDCDTKTAMETAFDLISEGVTVFIGPPCTEPSTVGLMASIYNLPMVVWCHWESELNDKITYNTLSLTYGSHLTFVTALMTMLRHYQWNVIGVLTTSYEVSLETVAELEKQALVNNVTVNRVMVMSKSPDSREIRNNLEVMQHYARIIFICDFLLEDLSRDTMIEAHDLDMTHTDYVFLDMATVINLHEEGTPWVRNDSDDPVAREAYNALYTFTYMARTDNVTYSKFTRDVEEKTSQHPFNYTMGANQEVDYYAGFLHDSVILYGLALHDVIESGDDVMNGTAIFETMKNRQFTGGITGRVAMNSNVNRNPDFYLFHIQNNQYRSVAIEFNVEELFVENPNNPIIWPDGTTTAPPAVPECGFNGCPYDPTILTVSLVIPTVTVAVLVIIICCIYGKKKRERDIANMLWKVKYEDIHIGLPRSFSHSSGIRFGRVAGLNSRNKLLGKDSRTTVSGMNSFASFAAKQNQLFAQIGTYKGTIVAISSLNPNRFNLTKDVMSDLKSLHVLRHENLNVFIGAVPEGEHACTLMQYCARGSLMDIIANEDINIDVMFKISFTTDIIKGMEYLHKSSVRSHGYLKSSNCVVDSRWVVKITDYGVLNTAFKDDSLSDYQLYTRQLWTAPELLRMANPPAKGTQKGDVYSFAILVQEIVFRSEPYYLNEEEPQDIIERVTKLENPPYRPYLPHDIDASSAEVIPLVLKCWSEDPQERPDFTQIRKTAHILNKGRRAHILDNMIEMMEKYTSNLEEIVAERTDELIREKKKTDMLLYKLLPISVAEQLKSGQSVSAETFDSVSLFFSDIVSFTEIAAQSTPMQVVDFLNDLYTCFDGILENYDVYKVETIGDAYMVVSGLPERNGNRHTSEIGNMALDLLSSTLNFTLRHIPEQQIKIRIGLHTGNCAAGVVGLAMPRYCLFGVTVIMASRMESNGKPLRIHISSDMNSALHALEEGFETKRRGDVQIKGKGTQTTYWLTGKQGYEKQLPKWDRESLDSTDSAVAGLMDSPVLSVKK